MCFWCAPVNDYETLFEDPQVKHFQCIKEIERDDIKSFKVMDCPIKLGRTKATIRSAPPKLGEHTEEILSSLGYNDNDTKEMKKNGII